MARLVRTESPDESLVREGRLSSRGDNVVGNFYCPHRPVNADEFLRRVYALVTKKLSPCSVRSIGQILRRAFPRSVPPPRRLISCLPEKRQAGRGVAVEDHVAGEPIRA